MATENQDNQDPRNGLAMHGIDSVTTDVFEKYIGFARGVLTSSSASDDDSTHIYLQWYLHPLTPLRQRFMSLFMYLERSFSTTGNTTHLNDAIVVGETAVTLADRDKVQEDDVELIGYMTMLARAYHKRFPHPLWKDDCIRATVLLERVVSLEVPTDPQRTYNEWTLAELYTSMFVMTKDTQSINKAIAICRSALQRDPTHPNNPNVLGALSKAHKRRYEEFNMEDDIQSSVDNARAALKAAQEASWEASDLASIRNILASGLLSRTSKSLEDLEEIIELEKLAVVAMAEGSTFRLDCENTLIGAYLSKVRLDQRLDDLDEAIQAAEKALRHREQMSPGWRAAFSIKLIRCYDNRYLISGDIKDEEKAIEIGSQEIDAFAGTEHENVLGDLYSVIAMCHWQRFQVKRDVDDEVKATQYAARGSRDDSNPDVRALTSFFLANFLHYNRHFDDAVKQYQRALQLLPHYALSRSGSGYSHEALHSPGWRMITPLAGACCVSSFRPDLAIELLESGRSMLWAHNLHLRSDHDKLATDYPTLAQQLKDVSVHLEATQASHAMTKYHLSADQGSLLDLGEKLLVFNEQREDILTKIRKKPGYEDFLLSSRYEQLRHVSSEGPVIVILVSSYLSCALILAHSTYDRPQVVFLADDLNSLVLEWSDALRKATEDYENGMLTEDAYDRVYFRPVLRNLWNEIISPIRIMLQSIAPYAKRVWWCPVYRLTFLPIHLVTNGLPWVKKRSRIYLPLIPSYTTTLSSLLQIRERGRDSESMSLLAVSCPVVEGFDNIPQAAEEVQQLEAMAEGRDIEILTDKHATREKVLASISKHSWVHLACHGVQSQNDPYRSYFLLDDGPLYLSDIIVSKLHNAQFAFLSACHTASGISGLADEAMHLSAALHYLGFRGSIATTWAVEDTIAPRLAKEIYIFLFRRQTPVVEDAAEALARAVQQLLNEGVPLSQLAPFIYVGV